MMLSTSLIGGFFGHLKTLALAAAVIAVVAYFTTTRQDAIRAASAKATIEQLAETNRNNNRARIVLTEVAKYQQGQRKETDAELEEAERTIQDQIDQIKAAEAVSAELSAKMGAMRCNLDCELPDEYQD